MSGELFTPSQKAAVRADQPVVAADLLVVAEYAVKSISWVQKDASTMREDVKNLREQVRILQQAVVSQYESFGKLAEMIKLVAGQAGGMSEDQVNVAIKKFVYQHENEHMKTVLLLANQMRAFHDMTFMQFEGPWREESYPKGTVTQRDGHTWIAVADTDETDVPGKCGDRWRRIAVAKDSK